MKKVKISICTLLLLAAASIAYSVWAGDDERENIWIIDKPGGGTETVKCFKYLEPCPNHITVYCGSCTHKDGFCVSLTNPETSTCTR